MELAGQDDGIQDCSHLACALGLVAEIVFAAHHWQANVAFSLVIVHGDGRVADKKSQACPVRVHALHKFALRSGQFRPRSDFLSDQRDGLLQSGLGRGVGLEIAQFG